MDSQEENSTKAPYAEDFKTPYRAGIITINRGEGKLSGHIGGKLGMYGSFQKAPRPLILNGGNKMGSVTLKLDKRSGQEISKIQKRNFPCLNTQIKSQI